MSEKEFQTHRAGMSLGTDYFGIEGPGCAEWVKESIRKAHEEQVDSVGPTSKTIALCLNTATQAQLIGALSAIQNELVSRHQAVTWVRPEQEVAMLMSELEDPDSMLNQGLADALDARELDMNVCYPYLQEDVYIPSCQIVGKGATDSCKHLIGRLDYCHECEHEHDEPIDLSEESI